MNRRECLRIGTKLQQELRPHALRSHREIAVMIGSTRGNVYFHEQMALGKLAIAVRNLRHEEVTSDQ